MYFAELASCHTRRKQIITGLSFFMSSGAAATLAAKMSYGIPLVLSAIVAILTAYSIAVGLDKRASAMARLHSQWNHLHGDYERLWNRINDDDAERALGDLQKRGRELSEAGTEMPLNERMLKKWEDRVFERYEPASRSAA